MKRKIILAGGTGTMGRILQKHFADQGDEVVVLTRQPRKQDPRARMVQWDAVNAGAWCNELEGSDVLINLAGRSVDCRYTAANRTAILESRVLATRCLGKATAQCTLPPRLWINLSSATVYRHAEDRAMDEDSSEPGTDFSPKVVLAWEKEFFAHADPRIRQVAVRCAMVFATHGGALPRFVQLVRMGLGGHHGNGRQYVSWVHEEDVARFFEWLIASPQVEGIINLAAPEPLPERDLMRLLRERVKHLVAFNIPEWMLGVGAFFLRTETELVLKSRRVIPTRAQQLGFRFEFTTMNTALDDLLKPRTR